MEAVTRKIRNQPEKLDTPSQVKALQTATAEDLYRNGMELEKVGSTDAQKTSRALGMGEASYRQLRDVGNLLGKELPPKEMELVKEAVAEINRTKQIKPFHEKLAPIIERIWGTSFRTLEKRDKAETKRMEAFDRAFGTIIHGCMIVDQIEIPNLSEERVKQAIQEITNSLTHLRSLRKQLEGIYQ